MKRWIALLALVLVSATYPHILVQVMFGDAVGIGTVEDHPADDMTFTRGDWTLTLVDSRGAPVSQTTFSPDYELPWGEDARVEELYVPVRWSAEAQSIEVADASGAVVATKGLAARCGDAVCSPGEDYSCARDCPLIADIPDSAAELPLAPEPSSSWKYLVLGGCALLIIILIVVLIHVNRPRPQQ